MEDSKSNKNELLGFILAATTAAFWVTGGVGVQGLNQTIPHFELNIIRLSGTLENKGQGQRLKSSAMGGNRQMDIIS